ncbi:unnamed protein product, partial [Iphiclides podalirius]
MAKLFIAFVWTWCGRQMQQECYWRAGGHMRVAGYGVARGAGGTQPPRSRLMNRRDPRLALRSPRSSALFESY